MITALPEAPQQLDLFAEAAPAADDGAVVDWDKLTGFVPKSDAYDELVPRRFPGFEYILYDMRIGATWYRVLRTSAKTNEEHLAVSSYLEADAVCEPRLMTLDKCWDFHRLSTPEVIANSIKAEAPPSWTRQRAPKCGEGLEIGKTCGECGYFVQSKARAGMDGYCSFHAFSYDPRGSGWHFGTFGQACTVTP